MTFFRKKENMKEKEETCCCGQPPAPQAEELIQQGQGLSIQVLGTGCKNCHVLLENTKEAVAMAGISAEVFYITDLERIAAYGVMQMPALAVEGKIISVGKVLKTSQIVQLLENIKLKSEGLPV